MEVIADGLYQTDGSVLWFTLERALLFAAKRLLGTKLSID